MKKLKIGILLYFLMNVVHGQIIMDSVKVYGDSTGFDSVFVRYTSQNQKITNFLYRSFNDACGTTKSYIIFEGCTTLTNIQKDTVFKFGFWGVASNFLRLYTNWDTSTTCSYPSNTISTDSYFYDICFTSSIVENDFIESKVSIYPNPAIEYFSLKKAKGVKISHAELFGIQGNIVKRYNQDQLKFDLSSVTNGVYFLKVTTSEGIAVKKIIIGK